MTHSSTETSQKVTGSLLIYNIKSIYIPVSDSIVSVSLHWETVGHVEVLPPPAGFHQVAASSLISPRPQHASPAPTTWARLLACCVCARCFP